MRVILMASHSQSPIERVDVRASAVDTTLLRLVITLPATERTTGAYERITNTVESSVRRILKDMYPGARGVRVVISV